jgi:hypothetical protein
MTNFSFEVKEEKFLLKGVGWSSIVAECDKEKLEGLVNKIVSSTSLELLGCKFEDENGNSVSLGKQLFLALSDERLSDFIISTGRGIGVRNSDRYCLAFI